MCRLLLRLRHVADPGSGADALVAKFGGSNGPGCKNIPLKADKCDVLECSARVDPVPWLPEHYREVVSCPRLFCPNSVDGLDRFQEISGDQRPEYIRLLARELESAESLSLPSFLCSVFHS